MNLQPTFTGYVGNTHDALILFQATISGRLPAVARRPHDRERSDLVRSGAIFVFNEQTSGIKRWTDGIAWSPSRILGNFLVYRQLEKPFTPGEKKQTNKRSRRKQGRSSPYSNNGNTSTDEDSKYGPSSGSATGLPIQIDLPNQTVEVDHTPIERSLVGSLVDSYGFKKDGLIKKTMSITVGGQPHHLVSYYKPEDVLAGMFEQPSNTAYLKDMPISDELTQRQNFRVPLDPLPNPAPATTAAPGQQALQVPYMQQSQQQQAPYPDLGYDVDVQTFDGALDQRVRTSPGMSSYYRTNTSTPATNGYMGSYRPFGSATPTAATAATTSADYYPVAATSLPPPAYGATRTQASGGQASSAAGYSPSLPPLAHQQPQSYNYGTYATHDYHVDPAVGAGVPAQSDPRRLPESYGGQAGQQHHPPPPQQHHPQQQAGAVPPQPSQNGQAHGQGHASPANYGYGQYSGFGNNPW